MHETSVPFLGNISRKPNMHKHSSLKEIPNKTSQSQNLKPGERKQIDLIAHRQQTTLVIWQIIPLNDAYVECADELAN